MARFGTRRFQALQLGSSSVRCEGDTQHKYVNPAWECEDCGKVICTDCAVNHPVVCSKEGVQRTVAEVLGQGTRVQLVSAGPRFLIAVDGTYRGTMEATNDGDDLEVTLKGYLPMIVADFDEARDWIGAWYEIPDINERRKRSFSLVPG